MESQVSTLQEPSGDTQLAGPGRGLSPLLPQPPRSLVIGMLCSPGGFGGLSFASIALKLSTRTGKRSRSIDREERWHCFAWLRINPLARGPQRPQFARPFPDCKCCVNRDSEDEKRKKSQVHGID